MTTQEIESLNTIAASLFSSSSLVDAGKRWGRLLTLLIPRLQVAATSMGQSEEQTEDVTGTPSLYNLHFVGAPLVRMVVEEPVFSPFAWGVVYAPPGAASGRAWRSTEYRTAAVATCYNIALTHHLHGLMDANNAGSLDKALKAYRLARGLLESSVSDVTAEPQDTILLALAIANNEGHVMMSRRDIDGARECWHNLKWLLQFAVPCPETLHFFAAVATCQGDDQATFSLPAPVA